MVLNISDKWTWDHWIYDSGEDFHIFFLQAPKDSKNANNRHLNASIGHAVSKDLKNWRLLPDALCKGNVDDWDDTATWTGSTIRDHNSGKYYLFYTGVTKKNNGIVQRIGAAVSDDLITWNKVLQNPLIVADPQIYACQENGEVNTDFRDPWVFYDDRDKKWHMLITAFSKEDRNQFTRGLVGHAISDDLLNWELQKPLSGPSTFGQTEVLQVVKENGRYVGIFCCGAENISPEIRDPKGGTFSVPLDSPTGPFHFVSAERFNNDWVYAGRIVRDRTGQLNLIGFVNAENDSDAPCVITDPIPVKLSEKGTLQII